VALWKDPSRGIREIPLEPGAHAVLLTVCMDRATRRSADGRWPANNGTECFDVALHQITPAAVASPSSHTPSRTAPLRVLGSEELTVLTGWAEAIAEALAHDPARAAAVLADARADAPWRTEFTLAPPAGRLREAVDALHRFVLADATADAPPAYDAVLVAACREVQNEPPLDAIVRRALLSMLEERQTRAAAAA
jgi:hypothetical protein